jgi:hypothetical protein
VFTSAENQLRRLILALLTFGVIAVGGELLALGHFEDSWQFVPFGLILLTLAVVAWIGMTGSAASVRALRVAMLMLLAAGGLGIVLHYRGNAEFQLDLNPDLSGWALFMKVLHAKAPPALAPGVMAQLGLLGLIYTFRHPALQAAPASTPAVEAQGGSK